MGLLGQWKKLPSWQSRNQKLKKYNCVFTPLFPFVPVKNVVPDSLHLFFRITDQLIHQLFKELKTEDNIGKIVNLDKAKHKRVTKLEEQIKGLGLHDFNFYVERDTKELKYRDTTGSEKYKILKNIKIKDFLPGVRATKLQLIWDNFASLVEKMQSVQQSDETGLQAFSNEA